DKLVTGVQTCALPISGAVVPDQSVPLGASRLRFVDTEPVDQVAVVIESVVDRSPAGLAIRHRRPKHGVLTTGAGQDGEEPAAVLMEVGHVLGGRQLAVGDVEEIPPAGQLAEQLPGAPV